MKTETADMLIFLIGLSLVLAGLLRLIGAY